MTDHKTASWISALEQARARLEMALDLDEDWRALRGAASGSRRLAHEHPLCANPVYRSWEQLSGAIADLRASAARNEPGRPQAEPTSERHRIELRHILEHIRSDSVHGGSAPATALAATVDVVSPSTSTGTESHARPAGPHVGTAPTNPEEATVSFVICEPMRAAPVNGRAPAQPESPSTTTAPEDDFGAEAEVTIILPAR